MNFPTKKEFFELLYQNKEFCNSLGQVMLAASKLESTLRIFLINQGHDIPENKATLGNLVNILKKNKHLSKNGEMHFADLKMQRNYLSHSLYDLFNDNIEETILPRENLVPEDVQVFAEKVSGTAKNFLGITKIIINEIDKSQKIKGTMILL
ncbi:MAG: hypothetical protein G3M70_06315 [Candidatus Nitronauta litoralis]|uniref:HEPN domain-containing protein n=1 Tax=Candidatus Nitronauta litoralis TaxID=2705533 RepID=A0A7T0BVB0_9BACT|nr:MAG: hypothetical protein G3M70_06315 [Candidatus Nitronauta litoralis]